MIAQQDPAGGRADDRTGSSRTTGSSASIDGTWTVVSLSKDGKAVDGADRMTVSIKDNVATFSSTGAGAGGAGGTGAGGTGAGGTGAGASGAAGGMKAVRLEFQSSGMIRATEAGADGKFGTTGGSGAGGTGSSGAGGTGSGGAGGTGDRSGTAGQTGSMTGVYVLTPDYLAVSMFSPSTAGGTGSGTGGSTDRSGTGGAGSSGAGGTGTGGAGAGAGGTGRDSSGTTGTPQMQSHMSVVLKRSGSGTDRR